MHENSGNSGEFGPDGPQHRANCQFDEILEINGREVLVTEQCLSVCVYDSAYARYDHLRINSGGERPILYFPPERQEMMKWICRMSPILSQRPEDFIREEYWDTMTGELEMTDEDWQERDRVMAAKADRLINEASDADEAFASLLGEA